jgi:hypothetical protein
MGTLRFWSYNLRMKHMYVITSSQEWFFFTLLESCRVNLTLTGPVVLKVAHSVSFEIFYLVMFHGNQIIWTVKIRTSNSTQSKGKQQARNKFTLSAGFQWTVYWGSLQTNMWWTMDILLEMKCPQLSQIS